MTQEELQEFMQEKMMEYWNDEEFSKLLTFINQHVAEVKKETAKTIMDRVAEELPTWLVKEIDEEYQL